MKLIKPKPHRHVPKTALEAAGYWRRDLIRLSSEPLGNGPYVDDKVLDIDVLTFLRKLPLD